MIAAFFHYLIMPSSYCRLIIFCYRFGPAMEMFFVLGWWDNNLVVAFDTVINR